MAKVFIKPGESLDNALARFQKAAKAEKAFEYKRPARPVHPGYRNRQSGFKREKNATLLKKDNPMGSQKKIRSKPNPPPPDYDFDY